MSYFRAETRGDCELLVPQEQARSGWGAKGQIRGTAISGALARAAECSAGGLDDTSTFRPVRWTVDLFRPAAMTPGSTAATVVRRGRRLCLIDAAFLQDDVTVARATLLLLAPGGTARGTTWPGPAHETPPLPDITATGADRTVYFSTGVDWTTTPESHRNAERKATWHQPVPVVDDLHPTPFQHAATVADMANLVVNWGTAGVGYINADLTLTLTRLPAGPELGLVAQERFEDDGISSGAAIMYDRSGPLGTVLLSGLANGALAVDPSIAVH